MTTTTEINRALRGLPSAASIKIDWDTKLIRAEYPENGLTQIQPLEFRGFQSIDNRHVHSQGYSVLEYFRFDEYTGPDRDGIYPVLS